MNLRNHSAVLYVGLIRDLRNATVNLHAKGPDTIWRCRSHRISIIGKHGKIRSSELDLQLKDRHGAECKICQRPFTCFRWMPGKGMRYKKTEVCQTCAKMKNVCQTCLLDLEFGLPVQVRDHALQIQDDLPRQGANRDYYIQNQERELALTDGTTPGGALAKISDSASNDLLKKLARNQPYYQRNKPHICSFFVKGECRRGEECPYRHEKPSDPDDPLSHQNMRDRYYGNNDPVAEKLLTRAKALPVLQAPEDTSITTLYVGDLGPAGMIGEVDLRDYFYQFGEIRSLNLLPNKGCAFISFTTRLAAEKAAERSFNKLILQGRRLKIRWGRPQAQNTQEEKKRAEPVAGLPNPCPLPDLFDEETNPSNKRARIDHIPMPPLPPAATYTPPAQLIVPQVSYKGIVSYIPASATKVYYPSQDPQRLGMFSLRTCLRPFILMNRASSSSTDITATGHHLVEDDDGVVQMLKDPYCKPARQCFLCSKKIELDYKNARLLQQFVSTFSGRVYDQHITGLCDGQQKRLLETIALSRRAGYMPVFIKDPKYLRDPKLFDPLKPIRPHSYA
ncbi:unnamed protein product [Onchocerca ochengi]|uniref:Pre-mRNA-splicing factor RBM22 n=2 Tax=Onchocerca TaxID=6281 RepID=A0A182DWU6_ONCOC|nr:unnamed protein product [Onchocerca ochengi]